MNLMTIAIVLFVIAQLLDVYTTLKAIKRGGREANPVVQWMMDKFGKAWPFVKLAIASGGAYLMYLGNAPILIILLALIVLYVAYRNHNVARK